MPSHLFAYGFRPNFLAAGLAAVVFVPMWAAAYAFGTPLGTHWPPTLWHAHEMLFGFIAAAIAGFLLTAVPSWTEQRGYAGRPLIALSVLWLLGRAAPYLPRGWPSLLGAVLDSAFLPAVALVVLPALLRARNRNLPLPIVLVLIGAGNALFHWSLAVGDAPRAQHVLLVSIDLVLVLATVVGGRVVPAFTNTALKASGGSVRPAVPALDRLTIGLMVLVLLLDLLSGDARVIGALALLTAAAHAARMTRWRTFATRHEPIVWILHAGYAWLPLGFLLKGLAFLTGAVYAAFWLHALTVGALATLIMAVMTRASLGHTGRPLRVAAPVTAAYVLLAAAGLTRVFGVLVLPGAYPRVVLLAAWFWTIAYLLFVLVYGPILTQPRVDGRPG